MAEPRMNMQDIEAMVSRRVAGINAAAARATYVGTKMSDLPKAYQLAMPVTADQDALAAAEYSLRRQYMEDMKVHAPAHAKILGWTPPAGSPHAENAAAPPASASPVDIANMPIEQVALLALKRSRPARGG
ncbi:MAG: hypothetical protein ABSB74_10245 [Tepidisphaeraceae bacterium]